MEYVVPVLKVFVSPSVVTEWTPSLKRTTSQ
jgi:hypothetical protein